MVRLGLRTDVGTSPRHSGHSVYDELVYDEVVYDEVEFPMPALAPSDDPRALDHWWPQRSQVPLVLETAPTGSAPPALHLSLSRLAAKRDPTTRARTKQSYFRGRAHPVPYPCTELVDRGRRAVLISLSSLLVSSTRTDVWRAFAGAAAILWYADDAVGADAATLGCLDRAARFGVPRILAWGPNAGRAREVRPDVEVVDGSLERLETHAVILDRLLSLEPRPDASAEPFELLADKSQPYGTGAGVHIALGTLLRGRPTIGSSALVGVDGRRVVAKVIEVLDARHRPNEAVVVSLEVSSRPVRIAWVAEQAVSERRLDALEALVQAETRG